MRYHILILFALSSALTCRASSTKEKLAETLFDTVVAAEAHPQTERFLETTARVGKLSKKAIAIHREFMYEILRSPESKRAYVKSLVESFTEEELKLVVDLAAHPGFHLYLAKSRTIDEMVSATHFELMQKRRPELERRLKEAGVK